MRTQISTIAMAIVFATAANALPTESDIRVGDYFIGRNGQIVRVNKIDRTNPNNAVVVASDQTRYTAGDTLSTRWLKTSTPENLWVLNEVPAKDRDHAATLSIENVRKQIYDRAGNVLAFETASNTGRFLRAKADLGAHQIVSTEALSDVIRYADQSLKIEIQGQNLSALAVSDKPAEVASAVEIVKALQGRADYAQSTFRLHHAPLLYGMNKMRQASQSAELTRLLAPDEALPPPTPSPLEIKQTVINAVRE